MLMDKENANFEIFFEELHMSTFCFYSNASSVTKIVRLNLFNHVLALFRAKFTCNLAIRYPVFRWE